MVSCICAHPVSFVQPFSQWQGLALSPPSGREADRGSPLGSDRELGQIGLAQVEGRVGSSLLSLDGEGRRATGLMHTTLHNTLPIKVPCKEGSGKRKGS